MAGRIEYIESELSFSSLRLKGIEFIEDAAKADIKTSLEAKSEPTNRDVLLYVFCNSQVAGSAMWADSAPDERHIFFAYFWQLLNSDQLSAVYKIMLAGLIIHEVAHTDFL